FEHKTALVRGSAKAGRWLLMISFGAFFGNTVMTRMAVFLERLQFLVGDWSPIVPGWLWVTAGLVAVLGVWAARRQARRSSGKQEAADE
ncbi:MAG: hypothetical protein ACPL7K_10255, partial [Armatimonadota bacterium]